jgi:hypothetical protein
MLDMQAWTSWQIHCRRFGSLTWLTPQDLHHPLAIPTLPTTYKGGTKGKKGTS